MSLVSRLWSRGKPSDDPEWQTSIVQEICMAMIRLAPAQWDSVAIVLEVPEHGMGTGLHHSPITPHPIRDFAVRNHDFALPDGAVFAATRKLEMGWVERKKTFKRAIITATRDGEGWEIRSDYEHE